MLTTSSDGDLASDFEDESLSGGHHVPRQRSSQTLYRLSIKSSGLVYYTIYAQYWFNFITPIFIRT